MTSTFRKTFVLILLSLPRAGYGMPQEQSQGFGLEQNRSISFEAIPVFGVDTTKGYVDVHYRINQNYFIYIHNSETPSKEEYLAKGEIVVELLDDQHASVAREIRGIRFLRGSIPQNGEILPDIQGAVRFAVSDGTFQIAFEVKDLQSGRSFLDRNERVTARRPVSRRIDMASPLLVEKEAPDSVTHGERFTVFNRGNNALFGGSGGYLVQLYNPRADGEIKLHWKIEAINRDEQRGDEGLLEGTQYTLLNGVLGIESKDEKVTYSVGPDPNPVWKTLYVALPLEKLETGRYNVSLELAGDAKESRSYQMSIVWPNRPFSIVNFQLAVDALRYIATESEVDEMTSFSSTRSLSAFRRFWKKRDPDTTTAYNEVLAEYYRRVDEAIRRFSTTSEPNGYKTDRGRIFILFGSPTNIERLFRPDAPPSEVWVYQSAKRKFVFTDAHKSGVYLLTATENL